LGMGRSSREGLLPPSRHGKSNDERVPPRRGPQLEKRLKTIKIFFLKRSSCEAQCPFRLGRTQMGVW
jgi:hypothetical protein